MKPQRPNHARTLVLLFAVMSLMLAACTQSAEPTSTTEDCLANGTCAEGPAAVATTSVADAAPDETYEGLPVGFTDEGYPFIGDADAPVTVEEFTDFLCPFCFRHTTETTPALLDAYAKSGQVKFVFRDFPLAGLHPTAPSGHSASLCVAEEGATRFWEFHGLLFANQAQWAGIPNPADYLRQAAQQLGVDMTAYDACLASPATAATVAARVAEAQSLGFNGTPSFQLTSETGETFDLVGAQPVGVFAGALDALLAGDVPPGLTASDGATSQDAAPIPSFTVNPESQGTYDGLTVGFTEDGFPFIGSPEARVTVMEYSDYLCPFCFRHTTQTTPALLEQYAESGEVNFVFRDLPLVGLHPTAPVGHQASVCVAEQGAAFFWAFHDSLFFGQQQWANLPDPSEFLAQTAETIGVDMAGYAECLTSGRAVPIVDTRVQEGGAAGFNGTPSFQFLDNGSGEVYELIGAHPVERFQEYLDALIAGDAPPIAADTEDQSADLPFWADEEGLAPDPDRPGYTVAGDPYKGDPNAPLVVVEFSDLQCPSCQRHAVDAQPVIDTTFVDTGQIMWVFKHFPLQIHPQSAVASAAAECGGDQGKFFEMERVLFENQEDWSTDDPDPVFVELAAEAGLDGDEFARCLTGRSAFERVLADIYDGTGVVENTPTFLMIYGGQGRRLEGARSADEFVQLLQAQLDSALTVDSDAGS